MPLLIALLSIINLLQGTLWRPSSIDVASDIAQFALGGSRSSPTPVFPFARDYSSLLLIATTSVLPWLMYRQFLYMQQFLPQLEKRNLIEAKVDCRDDYLTEVRRANERFRRAGGRLDLMFVALAIGIAILVKVTQGGGIYRSLKPADVNMSAARWSLEAYDGWWASFTNGHYLGAISYMLIATLLCYLFIKHIVSGLIFIDFFRRIDKVVRYRADLQNEDGFYGWRPGRILILTVFGSIANGLVGFFAIRLVLPADRFVLGTFPLIALLVIGVPAFVLYPLSLIKKALSRFKVEEARAVRQRSRELRRHFDSDSFEARAIAVFENYELRSIFEVPLRPFHVREQVWGSILVLVTLLRVSRDLVP